MPTDILYDFGVIDRIENGESYSNFTDEQINMYISYKQKQIIDSAMLEEQLNTQRQMQAELTAEAAYYRAQAEKIMAKIRGEIDD